MIQFSFYEFIILGPVARFEPWIHQMFPKFYSGRDYHSIASIKKPVMLQTGFEPTMTLLPALNRTVIWLVLPGNKRRMHLMKVSGLRKD